MRHQGATWTAAQRRLPTCQTDRCHIKGIPLTLFPWQQLLQRSKTKTDWFSGVSIVMFGWEGHEKEHEKVLQLQHRFFCTMSNVMTLPGSGDGVCLMTSWMLPASIGWTKQDSSLLKVQGNEVSLMLLIQRRFFTQVQLTWTLCPLQLWRSFDKSDKISDDVTMMSPGLSQFGPKDFTCPACVTACAKVQEWSLKDLGTCYQVALWEM